MIKLIDFLNLLLTLYTNSRSISASKLTLSSSTAFFCNSNQIFKPWLPPPTLFLPPATASSWASARCSSISSPPSPACPLRRLRASSRPPAAPPPTSPSPSRGSAERRRSSESSATTSSGTCWLESWRRTTCDPTGSTSTRARAPRWRSWPYAPTESVSSCSTETPAPTCSSRPKISISNSSDLYANLFSQFSTFSSCRFSSLVFVFHARVVMDYAESASGRWGPRVDLVYPYNPSTLIFWINKKRIVNRCFFIKIL